MPEPVPEFVLVLVLVLVLESIDDLFPSLPITITAPLSTSTSMSSRSSHVLFGNDGACHLSRRVGHVANPIAVPSITVFAIVGLIPVSVFWRITHRGLRVVESAEKGLP